MAFAVGIGDLATGQLAAEQANAATRANAAGAPEVTVAKARADTALQQQLATGKSLENQQTLLALQDQAGMNKALSQAAIAAQQPAPGAPVQGQQGAPVNPAVEGDPDAQAHIAPASPQTNGAYVDSTTPIPPGLGSTPAESPAPGAIPPMPGVGDAPAPDHVAQAHAAPDSGVPAPTDDHAPVHAALRSQAVVNGMPNMYSDDAINGTAQLMLQNGVRPLAVQAFVQERVKAGVDLAKSLQEIQAKGVDVVGKTRELKNNLANQALDEAEAAKGDPAALLKAKADADAVVGMDTSTPEGAAVLKAMQLNSPEYQQHELNRLSKLNSEITIAANKTKLPPDTPVPAGYISLDASPAERQAAMDTIRSKIDPLLTNLNIMQKERKIISKLPGFVEVPTGGDTSRFRALADAWFEVNKNNPDVVAYEEARAAATAGLGSGTGNPTEQRASAEAITASRAMPLAAHDAIIRRQTLVAQQQREAAYDTVMRRQKIPPATFEPPPVEQLTTAAPVTSKGTQQVVTPTGSTPTATPTVFGAGTTVTLDQAREAAKATGRPLDEYLRLAKQRGWTVK